VNRRNFLRTIAGAVAGLLGSSKKFETKTPELTEEVLEETIQVWSSEAILLDTGYDTTHYVIYCDGHKIYEASWSKRLSAAEQQRLLREPFVIFSDHSSCQLFMET